MKFQNKFIQNKFQRHHKVVFSFAIRCRTEWKKWIRLPMSAKNRERFILKFKSNIFEKKYMRY